MLSLVMLSVGLVPANPGESLIELAAWIDARLEAAWGAKGLPSRPQASDAVFLRRDYLKLTGSIPSVAEARDFLDPMTTGQNSVTLQAQFDPSALLLALGKATEAESLARPCREGRQKTLPRGHRKTSLAKNLLGGCLTAQHRYDEAEPLLQDSYRVLQASTSVLPAQRLEAVIRLVRLYLYEARTKAAEAAKGRVEGERLAQRGKEAGRDVPGTGSDQWASLP